MKLHGKVAVVTGGLRGIGHAIALAMAQEGADILIAGLSMDRAAQTEQEIRTLGRRCMVVRADVADEAAVKDMVARTVQHFGGLDILVNNAGIALFTPIDELTEAEVTAPEIARTPLRRLGLPVDVGKAAVFLACDDSSYMNGTTIVLDGGTMAVW